MPRFILLSLLGALAVAQSAFPQGTPMNGGSPRVSRDGSRILFGSDRAGSPRIYVMSADGSGVRQVSPDTMRAYPGHWSPDGRRVVYNVLGPDQVNAIVVQDVDGSDSRIIDVAKGVQSPSWSPDSKRILFSAGAWPNLRLYVMNPDGTGKQILTPGACPNGSPGCAYGDPVWSPDGRRLAFVLYSRPNPRIYVGNADGSGLRELSRTPGAQERPAWSPDSRRVAFQSLVLDSATQRPAGAYVAIVDVDSETETRVGPDSSAGYDETPSWFPDGQRLAIQSRRSGRWEIYVIDLTGRVLQQLTR